MQVDFDYGVDSIEMVIINSMAPMESFTAELGRGQSQLRITLASRPGRHQQERGLGRMAAHRKKNTLSTLKRDARGKKCVASTEFSHLYVYTFQKKFQENAQTTSPEMR